MGHCCCSRDELRKNSSPLEGLRLMAQNGETRIYILETEVEKDVSQTAKE